MAADLLVVSLAWLLSYWLRFEYEIIAADKGVTPFVEYLPILVIIWVVWGSVFRALDLYKPMRGVRPIHEVVLLLQGNALSLLILIAAIYLFREKTVPFSRLVFLYFGIMATLFTIMQRAVLRFILREARRKGYNLRYMLLVGSGRVAEDLVAKLRIHRELGIQLIGCLTRTGDDKRGPAGLPVVGSYDDLSRCLDGMDIDSVVVSLPLEDSPLLPGIMEQVRDRLVDVKIVPDLYQFVTLTGSIDEFEGLPVISVQTTPLDGLGRLIKRVIDLVLAILLIVLFAPIFLLIAILIKLTSRGPVAYSQERVSVDGSKFRILKFRTMRLDAEDSGPGWTTAGDNRVTALGRFLRASSLDELPQLFNVLRGDMSIVGPRPERPVYIEEFRKRVPRYMLRHKVPAGMTGWAQVHGWRGNTSIDRRVEYDLYYIENWSLLLDVKILFLTLFRGFLNRNAY